jgi:transglutaminase-like putative cysteine protease
VNTGRRYRVEHRTEYGYSDDVSASFGRAHLIPRTTAGQQCLSSSLVVDPAPAEIREHTDFYGNVSTYYVVRSEHRTLTVTSSSEVQVNRQVPVFDDQPWEQARAGIGSDVEARGFVLTSPLVRPTAAVSDYAAQTFTPDRPLGVAIEELCHRINTDFEYSSGSTSVRTTLGEVMHRRKGVCQDFAHLAVGCLRSQGMAARYVSGYLETQPPPGKPKLQGADASHAWAAVFVPGSGWIEFDPTNDQFADARYIVVGWGRDYTDVPPLKGVIVTDAEKSTMKVSVDVTRVEA